MGPNTPTAPKLLSKEELQVVEHDVRCYPSERFGLIQKYEGHIAAQDALLDECERAIEQLASMATNHDINQSEFEEIIQLSDPLLVRLKGRK
jgi:hypothetical protein